MNKKYEGQVLSCDWCGQNFEYRVGKNYCCASCRTFAWLEKKKKKTEKPKKLNVGYIKRLPNIRFKEYLPLLRRYNRLALAHKRGAKLSAISLKKLAACREYLKHENVKKFIPKIRQILEFLENARTK